MSRLKQDLIEAGKFGRSVDVRVETYEQLDSQNGVTRPEGTAANKALRDYAVSRMQAAGLEIYIDSVGNIFGRKNGAKTDRGAVMSGSHLDSVVNGGMFDGTLGVFTALEAVRRLSEEGFENKRPLEVVAFTGEEGSAFGSTLLGSSVYTGKLGIEEALNQEDETGRTLGEALSEIGYRGGSMRNPEGVDYYVETHIEQGPVLFREGASVGIVEAISGVIWLMLTVLGQGNHAGTTPMNMRQDALLAAADIVSFVNEFAGQMAVAGSATVATVGKLNVFPNGINVIPGRVEMGLDIRDVDPADMETVKDAVIRYSREVEKRRLVKVETAGPSVHSPQRLSPEVVGVIQRSAVDVGISPRKMNSGAVHDALNMAGRVKAGMIFVPSVNGVSHSPLEWTDWDSIEIGAKLLTQTLKNLSEIPLE